jgi:hypothetical protein
MSRVSSSKTPRWASGSRRAAWLLAAALLAAGLPARAGVPDWLSSAQRLDLPDYPADTDAVLLFNEQITTVKAKGEITTRYRRAYKILRPDGRGYGTAVVYFDDETRLTYLKGWSLPVGEKDYTVKEKDAVETQPFFGALYQDDRAKVLEIPAADPGNVVGYEYEQKARPFALEDAWWISKRVPVRRTRYVLELPGGWEFEAHWLHHSEVEPQAAGENTWVWEIENVPAVETEPDMPPWRALAARLVVTLYPEGRRAGAESFSSWEDVGRWYARLAASRRQAGPGIREKVGELTAGAGTLREELEALAAFAQHDVRYVAVEIGIGGYQPHAAEEIFANRYGDCKDKVTLLSAMLEEIGLDSRLVMVNTDRGVVASEAPSAYGFNHVILAIRLPADMKTDGFYALSEHERLGRLLFFDPTSDLTRLGDLPPYLQGNYGLVADPEGGELVQLPLLPPAVNRLLRTGKFIVTDGGDLRGDITEVRWGAPATWRRSTLRRLPEPEQTKVVENFLVSFLGGFLLRDLSVENLDEIDKALVLKYRFFADRYAKKVGNLLLVRPRVVGEKGMDLLEEEKERKYPVDFGSTASQSDIIEIMLPTGYQVDELPPPVQLDTGFASYNSEIEVKGNVLTYKRNYTVRKVLVPTEHLPELKEFFRQIAADERNQAVFKRARPPGP